MAVERILFRPRDVAIQLGISRLRVYELVATGELELITVGKSRRVPVDAIDAVARSRRSAPDTRPTAE